MNFTARSQQIRLVKERRPKGFSEAGQHLALRVPTVQVRPLAEQMQDFTPHITPEVFATEKEVVHNERRHRYEGHPLDRAWLDLLDTLYPEGHPYRGGVIGSHQTVAAITLADVGAFLAQHYHPANATLAIVGPVNPSSIAMLHDDAPPNTASASSGLTARAPRRI